MKKILAVLLAAAMLMGMSGCGGNAEDENAGALVELSANEAKAMFDNKTTFVFMIAQTTCSHCEATLEMLSEYVKDNALLLYYIEADRDINQDTFDSLWQEYFPDVDETPTFLYVVEGAVQDMYVGEMSEQALTTWLTRNNITLPNG